MFYFIGTAQAVFFNKSLNLLRDCLESSNKSFFSVWEL